MQYFHLLFVISNPICTHCLSSVKVGPVLAPAKPLAPASLTVLLMWLNICLDVMTPLGRIASAWNTKNDKIRIYDNWF